MNEQFDLTAVDEILAANDRNPQFLIAILQEIQEHYRYLPREVFPHLAHELNLSEARIYGVATFYGNFSLEPKGKWVIKVCDGTACHVRRSQPVLERLRKELGLTAERRTTPDQLFTVETVACLGACGLAPVMMTNEIVHPAMTPDKASAVIARLREQETGEAAKEGAA